MKRASACGTFLVLIASFCLFHSVRADDISVSAALSADTTTTDQPVSLTVTVTGGMSAKIPSEIQAEGLDIEFQGQSRHIEMMNFQASVSVTNTYVVGSQTEGKFTIPPIEIQAGGKIWKTDPLTLTVGKGSTGSQGQGGKSSTPQVYSELIIPKDTAYVGEIIPAEIRFYFDNDPTQPVQFQVNPPGQVPQIAGEGFSKLRFPQPRMEQTEIKGRPYRVLIYKTAIVAAKAGDMEVGPSQLDFVVSLPQRQQRRSGLNDPFGNDPFSGFFQDQRIERQMAIRGAAVKIKVKALPPGKPAGFSGAVGSFTMQASAKPAKVKVGDPVTLTAIVSGRGNFDLVSSPQLTDATGWHGYPPSGSLSSNDDIGVSGDKTFSMALIPEGPAKTVPSLEFTYFDSAQEKYVTLHSDPIPIEIDGNAVVASTPTPNHPAAIEATPTHPSTTPVSNDLPIVTTWSAQPQSFTPLWRQSAFWMAQGIPLLLLVGLAGPKLLARFQPDSASLQKRAWQQEYKELRVKIRSDKPEDFFPAAARMLVIGAALKTGRRELPTSNEEILEILHLEGDEAETAREIIRRRDELSYGGGRGGRELSEENRRRYESVLPKGDFK